MTTTDSSDGEWRWRDANVSSPIMQDDELKGGFGKRGDGRGRGGEENSSRGEERRGKDQIEPDGRGEEEEEEEEKEEIVQSRNNITNENTKCQGDFLGVIERNIANERWSHQITESGNEQRAQDEKRGPVLPID